jgi:acyl-CoA synthetase (AMP-forming)/AMP-acid ligase II
MRGLMMDYQLTLPAVLRHAEARFADKSVVSRMPDKSMHRTTYGACISRARRLAVALRTLGIDRGDRVATFCWNHYRHLEAYFGIPMAGGVAHTLNLRLHPDDLSYIVNHADDRAIIVDDVLLPVFDKFRPNIGAAKVIVIRHAGGAPAERGDLDYEAILADADERAYTDRVDDENLAATMCYTSGTTGRPKGVVYSHRAQILHSFGMAMMLAVGERDVVMAVVPMFHANAWGLPYTGAMAGATQVFPGPHLDPPSIVELLEREHATITGGVPTIWNGVLQLLDSQPGRFDLSAIRTMLCGGSAVPPALLRGFQERHGLKIVQAWGMTETGPLATVADLPSSSRDASDEEKYAIRARQGWPVPFVELRVRGAEGPVPADGETMGEIEVRGPWIASGYFRGEDPDRFTADGWMRTGDIAVQHGDGCIEIRDRAKDVIKSGGEWISSVALENALMDHPAVLEAAVIAIPDPRWDERPLAVIVKRPGHEVDPVELSAFIAPRFAKWWLPEAYEFVTEIPRTPTGKTLKRALRERFKAQQRTKSEVRRQDSEVRIQTPDVSSQKAAISGPE